jgi:glycosyltransferase involved in cell wall biosynthesis
MKVLVISATFPPMRSGGADHAFRLCQYLADAGLDVHVVTRRIENVATDPRIKVHPVMRSWSWMDLPRLLSVVRRCRPDVVNLHFTGGIYDDEPMVTFVPTILKKLIPKLRVVTQIEYPEAARVDRRGLPTRVIRKIAAFCAGPEGVDYGYGTILRDSDRIIVLSDLHRRMLSDHFSRVDEKCVLIPPPPIMRMCAEVNGKARSRGRSELRVTAKDFVLAYYGYLYPGKGVETLLEAFRLLCRRNDAVHLVMVGGSNEVVLGKLKRPDYAHELRDIAERLDIANKVTWTGYYPTESEQASVYLKSADACVLPFDDGVMLNRSSLAAVAAHGLPIIATRGDVLEPVFRDSENLLLCPPKDPEAIAKAIELLMHNPGVRNRLSEGALAMAAEWFSWEKAVERTLEAFRGHS